MEVIYAPGVLKFIEELPIELNTRVGRSVGLLVSHGHLLRPPDSKRITKGLFELRILSALHVRLFYFFQNGKAIILHGRIKKQRKISRKDIKQAIRVRKAILE